MMGFFACVYAVNRRVGGLEIIPPHDLITDVVNRRVGGLEKYGVLGAELRIVNRRVGGLEIVSKKEG